MTHRSWLIMALLLGALLRGVGLFASPPGPNVDEVSNAIDAECIWRTGKDRHGAFLPLYLRAFDDHREGVFVLTASPLSSIMGPSNGLRILSFAIGMLTIVATYGAVHRIVGPRAAVWGAFFIATDPQHVLWSRIGMEVILVPLGVALTWWSMSFFASRPVAATFGMVGSLLLTVYSGMMGRPAATIMFVASLFVSPGWPRVIRRSPGAFLLAVILLFVGLLPAWENLFSPEATARFAEIKDTNDSGDNPWFARAIRFATYWSPTYLMAPMSEGMPNLPWASKIGYAEWVCLMIGIGALVMHPFRGWNRSLLLAVLLAAIPAAFTNTVAPSRVFFALPVFVIIMSQGTEFITRWIGVRLASILLATGISVTTGLVSYDLSFHTQEHLQTFFWRDAGLAVEKLVSLPADSKYVDAQIPFMPEEVIIVTHAPENQYQGRLLDVVHDGAPLGGVTVALPQMHPVPPGSLFLTWHDQSTPGAKVIDIIGRFKIVEIPK